MQWAVGQCQLESVTLLPVDGAISELPARFVDPAVGAAAAWNMLMCVFNSRPAFISPQLIVLFA